MPAHWNDTNKNRDDVQDHFFQLANNLSNIFTFLYSVRGADAGNGIRVFIPDIGMFIAGLVTWLLCRSLEKPPGKDVLQHSTDFDMGNQVSLHNIWYFEGLVMFSNEDFFYYRMIVSEPNNINQDYSLILNKAIPSMKHVDLV